MDGPTSPKNIVPRSIRVNELEQLKKNQPEIQQDHASENLKKDNLKRQQQVNKSEESEYKKIRDQEQEGNNAKQQKEQEEKKQENEENNQEENIKENKGTYLDIKI